MNERLTCVVLFVMLSSSSVIVSAAERNPHWAILIGVNDYVNLHDLKCCVADEQALYETLLKCGFPDDQVVLLHDDQKEKRFQPTRANIDKQVDLLLRQLKAGDKLVVAFSGHGMVLDGQNYLCPTDANWEKPAESMIEVQQLYKRLEKSEADFKLVLIDACRDDPRPPGKRTARSASDANESFAANLSAPRGTILLTSCEPREQAQEDPKTSDNPNGLGHGVFMHFVLKGLSGEAANGGDRKVSVLNLYQYTERETAKFVAKKFNDSQHPQMKGTLSGSFEFAIGSSVMEKVLTSQSTGMKLILIPAGEFEMGSRLSEKELAAKFANWDAKEEYFADQRPPHRVKISRPFYLGQYEVTVGQFRKFVNDDGYKTEAETDGNGGFGWNESKSTIEQDQKYNWKNPGFTQTDEHPVVNVTWNDAKKFCEWLVRKDGQAYRLPTEAEWEYACKAGATTLWSNGDDPEGVTRVGNIADGTAKAKHSSWKTIDAKDGFVFTAPIGKFMANSFGLYDMHGNVLEWCDDVYDANVYGQRSGTTVDPKQTSGSESRVLRGGSWSNGPLSTRSACRIGDTPDVRINYAGFRISRTQ